MDEALFTAFYANSRRRLMGFLARATSDRSTAEDLCQESYVRFLSTAPAQLTEEEAPRYLFRIASNLVVSQWRKNKVLMIEDPEVVEQLPAMPQLARESALDLRAAFQKLTVRDRALLWLAHVEGNDHNRISELLHIKAASVRVLLSRARSRLFNLVKPQGGEQ